MSYTTFRPYSGFGATSAPGIPPMQMLPTKREWESDIQPYVDVANAISPPSGFDPKNPDTWKPELMIPYGVRMVTELQKHLGLAPLELTKITDIVKGELKWLDELGIPLTSVPTNVRDVCMIFARCSAVAACKQLGIPPEIGTTTVDALADGEFTSEDVESIGGVAGGMGGSYLCGMIGLPPQLGGYLGSFAGNVLGGLVSSAIGLGGGDAEREERARQLAQMRSQVKKELNKIRGQYQTLVMPIWRQLYWELFDNLIEDLENFWELTECQTGYPPETGAVLPPIRFPLLWGANGLLQGLPAGSEPFLRHPFDGSRCPPLGYQLARPPQLCLSPSYITPGTATGCPSMFGCPYPAVPTLGAEGGERVAQAFAAYNAWWIQPPNRAANTEAWKNALPEPPSDIVNFIARRTQERQGCESAECRRYADRDINNAVGRYNEILGRAVESAGPSTILGVGMRIQGDIVASGSVYTAATALRASKNAIRTGRMDHVKQVMGRIGDPAYVAGLQRNVKVSRVYGAVANGVLNYGLPALGAVLLGAAMLKRRQ